MQKHAKTERILSALLQLLLLATGAAYAMMYGSRPLLQDDLAFFRTNGEWISTHSPAFLRLPTHVLGSWLSLNGRLGDALNILWLNFLPRPLLIILTGLMVWALFAIFIRWARRLCPGMPGQYLAAALLMFAFPWWDNSQLLVVAFNYVWSSVLMLAWLAWLLRRPAPRWWPACLVFGFFAGAQHEALGLPVAVALLCALVRPFGLFGQLLSSRETRKAALGGILGALYTLLSPALWSRAGANAPENSALYVLISSNWAVILLVAAGLLLIVFRPGRTIGYLRTAHGGAMLLFAVAACVSAAMSMYSGIVGRTGAFAQIFAFLALYGLAWPLIARRGVHLPGACSVTICLVLWVAMAAHIFLLTKRQLQLNHEASEVVDAFSAHPTEPVYYDIPAVSDEPWWLIGKAAGLPPCYDPWHEEIMRRYHGGDSLTLIVLPAAWRTIPVESLPVVTVPEDCAGLRLTQRNGRLYFLSPLPYARAADSLKRIPVPTALRHGDRIATMNP